MEKNNYILFNRKIDVEPVILGTAFIEAAFFIQILVTINLKLEERQKDES